MDLGAAGPASPERDSSEHGSSEHLRETRTARRLVYSGRLLTVYEDDVQLVDGTSARREVVIHPGAVAIVEF
jgi:hypothetical protein